VPSSLFIEFTVFRLLFNEYKCFSKERFLVGVVTFNTGRAVLGDFGPLDFLDFAGFGPLGFLDLQVAGFGPEGFLDFKFFRILSREFMITFSDLFDFAGFGTAGFGILE
jgi:hypothetical protein